ncbi:MAG TPA: DUF2085 domain-containing protein [Anaerolineaceae bacterium]|nr:DUF2085 domain-containing protein [Anaerolineaceae bacterium]
MVEVFLLSTDPTSEKVEKIKTWLSSLQEIYPHQLNLVDLRQQIYFKKRTEETLIVRIDEKQVTYPENSETIKLALSEAHKNANSPDYRPAAAKDHLGARERFSLWFSRHYLALINIILALYVGLPILAPVMMRLGQVEPAKTIYGLYRPLCHQLAYRSFFLFGEQVHYPLEVPAGSDRLTYSQISGNSGENIQLASKFVGNERAGYKIALCQRDVAIYGSLLLFGIVFALTGRKLKPLLWWLWILLAIGPMGLDGVWQLVSSLQLPFLSWLPVHESTPFLRVLTGAAFGWFTAWFGIPTIEETVSEERLRLEAKAALESQRS